MVLVNGANSFVGRHMIRHFTARGYSVQFTRSATLDLTSLAAVSAFFASAPRFALVIHCVSAGGSRLVADGSNVLDLNLRMLTNVMSQRDKYDRLVFFSSGAALNAPDTAYGYSKLVSDMLLRHEPNAWYEKARHLALCHRICDQKCWESMPRCSESFALRSTRAAARVLRSARRNFRIFGCFGPGEPERRFITSALRKRATGEPIEVHQDKLFDNVYIEDVCELVELILSSRPPPRELDTVYRKKFTLAETAKVS